MGMVVVAEILMNNFFKQEKHPYPNNYDKILVCYIWIVAMTSMVVVMVLMSSGAHVRQGVEEYVSQKTT